MQWQVMVKVEIIGIRGKIKQVVVFKTCNFTAPKPWQLKCQLLTRVGEVAFHDKWIFVGTGAVALLERGYI
jgi:hypothetical protein